LRRLIDQREALVADLVRQAKAGQAAKAMEPAEIDRHR
jgi:hypothetical protein